MAYLPSTMSDNYKEKFSKNNQNMLTQLVTSLWESFHKLAFYVKQITHYILQLCFLCGYFHLVKSPIVVWNMLEYIQVKYV